MFARLRRGRTNSDHGGSVRVFHFHFSFLFRSIDPRFLTVPRSIASAVALPEPEENSNSSGTRLKRRQFSAADGDNKRRRLSIADAVPESQERLQASPTTVIGPTINANNTADGRANRRESGAAEERKRGQRLFGALLGTLSQSSSSAAQKRRADIEKKQQA